MIAIITGDIINSEKYSPEKWMRLLTDFLKEHGNTPEFWEIYRGDEFQLRTRPELALSTAIHLKATIKTLAGLDVRIGIGLGEENFKSPKITQSNGPAYINSGRIFDISKKEKINLLVKTENKEFDDTINLMLELALNFMDAWTPVSAETLEYIYRHPDKSQKEIARQLEVSQSNISQRLSRSNFELVLKLNSYFRSCIEEGI